MSEYKLGEIEMRFAQIIWDNQPLSSGELVKLAERHLTWNRSTTYTILRRLSNRGIFKNENGTVSAIISKEELIALQSEQFVEQTFSGSIPGFLAAFTRRKPLSEQQLSEIQKFLDEHREVR